MEDITGRLVGWELWADDKQRGAWADRPNRTNRVWWHLFLYKQSNSNSQSSRAAAALVRHRGGLVLFGRQICIAIFRGPGAARAGREAGQAHLLLPKANPLFYHYGPRGPIIGTSHNPARVQKQLSTIIKTVRCHKRRWFNESDRSLAHQLLLQPEPSESATLFSLSREMLHLYPLKGLKKLPAIRKERHEFQIWYWYLEQYI